MAIDLTPIRALTLCEQTHADRRRFLSAASGLLRIRDCFYVAADDELSLGVFPAMSDVPGELFRLFPGDLPNHHAERKKRKPDLEAIAYVSPAHHPPFGAILAVPSGSKPNRYLGALVPLDKTGELLPSPRTIDFGPLYAKLLLALPDLNIEGAVIDGTSLKLFQRGNALSGQNALIDVGLDNVMGALHANRAISAQSLQRISAVDLGILHGVALGFTDASLYMKQLWFLAVAEKTASTYDDGDYCGATIGRINQDNSLTMFELNCPQKPEGLCFSEDPKRRDFFVVTDADHALSPSILYRGSIAF